MYLKRYSNQMVMLSLFLLALTVKYVHVQSMVVDNPLRGDALQYVQTAINISEKGVFGHKFNSNGIKVDRLPGYPLLLSAIFKLADKNAETFYHLTRFFNVLLGSFSVVLIYLLGRQKFSLKLSVLLSLLVLLNPHLLAMEGYVLTETLFLFETLLLLLVISKAIEKQNNILWGVSGFVMAFTFLTRPAFIVFLPFLCIYLLILNKKYFKQLAVYGVIGFFIGLSPWIAYTQYHGISITGTKNDTGTLSAGFYPNFIYKNPAYYGFPYKDPEGPDIHHDKEKAVKQLLEWVKDDPIKYLHWFVIGKPVALWQWNTIQGAGDIYIYPVRKSAFKSNGAFIALVSFYKAAYPVMLIGMLLGLMLSLVNRGDMLVLLISSIVIYFVLIHIIFFSLPRYSIPLRPLMLFLDFYLLSFLFNKIKTKDGTDNGSPT